MATDPVREQGPDPMAGEEDVDEADGRSEREAEEEVLEEEQER